MLTRKILSYGNMTIKRGDTLVLVPSSYLNREAESFASNFVTTHGKPVLTDPNSNSLGLLISAMYEYLGKRIPQLIISTVCQSTDATGYAEVERLDDHILLKEEQKMLYDEPFFLVSNTGSITGKHRKIINRLFSRAVLIILSKSDSPRHLANPF